MDPYLYTYGLEKCRVSEWKLHHLLDLGQLLPAASNVIIAHFIQGFFLILPTGNVMSAHGKQGTSYITLLSRTGPGSPQAPEKAGENPSGLGSFFSSNWITEGHRPWP